MYFNNISFILHKPQLSENIGLCARAMKNFGFKNLLVVEPKPIFPNDKIIATSVGAKNLIKKTKIYSNLEGSLINTDILIATSARFRNKNIKHISLDELVQINFTKKVSFLFGSEASGLTNEEISYADYTLQIPSNSKFRSLNLSHSLVIVAQAVSYLISINRVDFQKSKKIQRATKNEISNMLKFCLSTLENQNFFKQKAKKPIMIENLRSIFYKMELSQKEIRILSSVFAGLAKKP